MKIVKYTVLALALVFTVPMLFGAGTPAGTQITNIAYGEYKDANGNSLDRVESDPITIIVSQLAGVDINPPTSALPLSTNSNVLYSLQLTNTGNGVDAFSLSAVNDGDAAVYTVEIYQDIAGNGIIDGLDAIITSSGELVADASIDLLIKVININAVDADVTVTTVTATSDYNGTVVDTGVLTTTITAATLEVSVQSDNSSPKPGDIITYSVCVTNTGSETAYDLQFTVPVPDYTTYFDGSIKIGSTGIYTAATGHTDDASDDDAHYSSSFIYVYPGDLATEGAICIFYQVKVNDGVPVETEITNSATVGYKNVSQIAYNDIEVGGGSGSSIVSQYYDVTLGEDVISIADPGDVVLFPLSITNSGNGTDLINLSYTSTFLTWTFYLDVNGDGVIDDGDYELTDSEGDGKNDVGNLTSNQTVYIIAKTTVPINQSDRDEDLTTISAISAGDQSEAPASDVSTNTTTVTAPALTLTKSVSPTEVNQPPGTTLTYSVAIKNLGSGVATEVVITDAIPVNTTYVPNSMTLNGIGKTDNNDSDQAKLVGNSVIFHLPAIGAGGENAVSVIITFQVKID